MDCLPLSSNIFSIFYFYFLNLFGPRPKKVDEIDDFLDSEGLYLGPL